MVSCSNTAQTLSYVLVQQQGRQLSWLKGEQPKKRTAQPTMDNNVAVEDLMMTWGMQCLTQ